MSSPSNRYPSTERRRHFRVQGEWPIRVEVVEETGALTEFDARALDISMGGILLEAAVNANLWVDKKVTLVLPGAGPIQAVVRRFLEYGEEGHTRTRWGLELAEMNVHQRAHWARFIFSEAHRLDQAQAHREFVDRRLS